MFKLLNMYSVSLSSFFNVMGCDNDGSSVINALTDKMIPDTVNEEKIYINCVA